MKKIILLSVAMISGTLCFAQKVQLDSTFGINGIVLTRLKGISCEAKSIALQTNGKIVITGVTKDLYGNPDSTLLLLRYDCTGALDTSFNHIGYLSIPNARGNSVAIQSDGKIVAGGCIVKHGGTYFTIFRFNENGSADTTFGIKGIKKTNFSMVNSIAIQSNGKIVAAGGTGFFEYARFNIDGSLDSSYARGGKDTILYKWRWSKVTSLLLQKDQKAVLVGSDFMYQDADLNGLNLAIARVDTNGKLDHRFNKTGKQYKDFLLGAGQFYGGLQKDGKLVVTSDFYGTLLLRYRIDGTIDSSFGINGMDTSSRAGMAPTAAAIAFQQDNKILIGGSTWKNDFLLIRYDTSGLPDTSFNHSSFASFDLNKGSNDIALTMVLQPNGKIILAGYSDSAIALIRINNTSGSIATGTLNFTVQKQKPLIFPNPIHDEAMLQYTLEKEEQISINIFDLNGRIAKKILSNQTQSAGIQKQEMNLADLKSGTYIIHISNGDGDMEVKIVKE